MDCVGDFSGGGRVDGGAVDEESLLRGRFRKDRLEETVEDVFDMGGFREDGDDGFLRLGQLVLGSIGLYRLT